MTLEHSETDNLNLGVLVQAGIEKLRSKLLDLSLSNRLLNFKHSEKSRTHIRIIDEIPEVLFDKLDQHKNLQFDWIEEPDFEPPDELTSDFRNAFAEAKEVDEIYLEQREKLHKRGTRRQFAKLDRALKDRVRVSVGLPPRSERSVADRARELGINPSYDLPPNLPKPNRPRSESRIQTLFYRESMDSKLAAIREGDKTLLEDAGINALHAAFGFVEWYESTDSEIPVFAPLVFYPVEIQRTLEDGLYKYVLAVRDDEIETNQAFAELLKATVGLELPPWDHDASLSNYFEKVHGLLDSQKRWRLKRWVTVGLFTFAKLAMYGDLDSKRWVKNGSLTSHPILNDLLIGKESVSDVALAPDYEIDSAALPAKNHVLVTDADSSQHSAVIDVLKGKNLVIQGPPGTGKSQTITNIIASAMNSGKKILFLAEKMAALQVVKNRLDHFGLGQFCLEVHSNKTRKTAVLKSIEDRLNFPSPRLDANQLRQALGAYEQAREQLIYYVTRLKEQVGETGLTVHAILRGNCVRMSLADRLHPTVLKTRIDQPLQMNPFVREELKELSHSLQTHAVAINNWQRLSQHPWRGVQNHSLDIFQSDELLSALQGWNESLIVLRLRIQSVSSKSGWPIELSVKNAQVFVDKAGCLPAPDGSLVESVVQSVKTQTDLLLLDETIGNVDALAAIRNEIARYTVEVDRVVDLGPSYFQNIYAKATSADLLESPVSMLEEVCAGKEKYSESISKAQIAIGRIGEIFGIDSPRLSDVDGMLTAISLLQTLHQTTLRYRDPVIMSEEHLRDLERGAQKTEALQKLTITIKDEFRLSLAPPLVETQKAAQLLLSANLFQRLFSRECRGARRLFKSVFIPTAAQKANSPGLALARLADYLLQVHEIETSKELQRSAGRFYRGVETPWRELIAVSKWATNVRRTFTPQLDSKNAFGEVLLSADAGKIDAILAFGRSHEYPFLVQLLANFSGTRESSLESLATKERNAAQEVKELVRDLARLSWQSNTRLKDIKTISDMLKEAEELKAKLTIEKVSRLLGSVGSLWTDRATALRETGRYLNELAKLSLPQVFWERLAHVPVASLYESLNSQAHSVSDALSDVRKHQDLVRQLAELENQRWMGVSDLDEVNIQHLEVRVKYALDNKDAFQPYLDFLRLETRARNTPLAPILDRLEDSTSPFDDLPETFEFIFYRSCAESLFKEDPKLSSHSGASHEQLRRRYQQLDRKILELHRQQIARTLMSCEVPSGIGRGKASDFTDLALIQRQIGLQRRHTPLRELFRRAGNAVQALKPCFMMSPMSVAQFLDPEGLRFDLVVMDEASQIRPEDAIGSIARGTQIVVVGDPKQLPPTAFFEKVDRDEISDEDSDEAAVEDLTGQESILDLTRGPYQPVRRLGWHYRSQHESLIAFSNREFYDTSLIVFPSPRGDDPDFGVRLEEVDGIYGDGLNRQEAEALVTAAQSFMRQFPHRSLGIVAMNKPQQELIQKMMDDLFASDVESEAYRIRWENTLDTLFVKNLENVQGDERDVIFISTVYGKDSLGNFYQRFGPINGAYGHRRLNVLFTRAKQQVRLFTSMKSADIRLEATSRLGVKALKNYLAYAKNGHLEAAELTGREPDSEFEQWVIQMLEERGYEVVPQLGVAGYFIDLAVRDPDHSGSFILGVECDGAMYHSARSVRDRDRLREEVLVRLGWKIYRIWSTDWFRNPRAEFLKLVAAIEDLRHPQE